MILRQLDENLVKATSAREALGILLRMEFAVVLLDVACLKSTALNWRA